MDPPQTHRRQLVISKTSANRNYGQTGDESSYRELEHIEMFRSMARHLRQALCPG